VLPNKQLVRILEQAYPCAGFETSCRSMCWEPLKGLTPAGYIGATHSIGEVEVMFVLSEPYEAAERQPLAPDTTPFQHVTHSCRQLYLGLMAQQDQFHRNLRFILEQFFPNLELNDQLKRCWITPTILCSTAHDSSALSEDVFRQCRRQFFIKQLQLFPRATKVALGSKAAEFLKPYCEFLSATQPSPPACNHRGTREGWVSIGRQYRMV
jgi:hypothetical protein